MWWLISRHRWATLIAGLLLGSSVWGRPMVVRHFSSTDGLPVASASAARTDADGFLWVATHDGLARFDGREFTVYDAASNPEMSGNRISALYADSHRRLYALSSRGELLAVHSSGITRIRPDATDPDSPVRYVDPSSLCLTLNRGWYCPDGRGGFALRQRFTVPGQVALALAADDTAVWQVVAGEGIYLADADGRRLVYADPHLVPQPKLADFPIAVSAARELLLGTDSGLLRVGAGGGGLLTLPDGGPPDGEALVLVQLRTAPEPGSLVSWLGFSHGLYRLDPGASAVIRAGPLTQAGSRSWRSPDGALWRASDGQLYRDDVLQLDGHGEIRDLYFDASDSVWVSTLRDGLYALHPARVDLLNVDRANVNDNLYSVAYAEDGSMWLGSLGGGLQRMDREGRITTYGVASGLPGLNPWVVAVAPDQSIYTATFAPGLYRKAVDSERFLPLDLPPALREQQILALSFMPDGNLWVGTSAGAWRRRGGAWQPIWPLDRAMRINAILPGPRDTVHFATRAGVWRLDADGAHPVASALLTGISVRGLFRDSEGTLWGSTEGRGLLRMAADDVDGERALFIGRAAGLPSNSPHAVVEDAGGNLWVNSNQGIFRLTRSDLTEFLQQRNRVLSPLTLGLADGLTELEGNGGVQPAAAVDRSGRIWFPSQRGVVRIDPLKLPLRRRAPIAVIDGIDSQGSPVTLEEQQLPLGKRSVQVRYNAADLHAGAEVRFRYRLHPVDLDWNDAGNRRVAAFAALAPNRYRLEVVAGNSDGIWAETPVALEFIVPAYWHETREFRGALALALLLLIVGLVHWRVSRLRQRAAALDAQVHLRTQELSAEKDRVESTLGKLAQAHGDLALTHGEIEVRNRKLAEQTARLEALDRFRTRLLADVSHELRTPLMLIKLPLREMFEGSRKLPSAHRERLQLPLQQTERLSHLVEQLVGLVQAEAGQLRLKARRIDLVAWARRVLAGFAPMAERQRVQLALRTEIDSLAIYADADHLTTILSNLLDNALKYAPADSVVVVSIKLDAHGEGARIGVADRGPGYPPELAAALFDRFFRAEGPPRAGREGLGIGLALARELIELHGGRIGTSVSAAEGTVFWLDLPLGSAHIALDELALEPGGEIDLATVAPIHDGGILLVEDHPELAAYLTERLAEFFPVRTVASAEAAIPEMQRGGLRLLVSDVKLPGMDGVELCRTLKAMPEFVGLPVILISAKSTLLDRDAGIEAGAIAWITKPFELATLIAEIRRYWPADLEFVPGTPAPAVAVDAAVDDPILQIARQRMADPAFGVAEWSEAAHLSDRQLRRRVADLTGLSPIVWLREQRLLKVRELISSGACQTLAEAGHQCGYDNPGYLYRLYRARFGEG
ncbi:MAG: response regulator [Xanthomonadales bacterium]|jgi:signal transduction histidine kinase/CheY-like chemotaxis protein/streptogramin lyase|nr:response regulator [Xanthomonadales bacterium]